MVYHSSWLLENLPGVHPYFQRRFFRDNAPARLQPSVLTGEFYCEASKMEATGIPGHHIVLAKELMEVKESFGTLADWIKTSQLSDIHRCRVDGDQESG